MSRVLVRQSRKENRGGTKKSADLNKRMAKKAQKLKNEFLLSTENQVRNTFKKRAVKKALGQ